MTLSAFSPPDIKGTKLQLLILACVIGITTLTLLQDLIEAFINQFPFYFSESLLFKTTWILFFPFLLLQGYFLNTIHSNTTMPKIAAVTIVPFVLHLAFIPLVIWGVSFVFFDHTYTFARTLEYTLSGDLYKLVLGYCLLPLLLKKKTVISIAPLPVSDAASLVQSVLEKIIVNNGKTRIPLNVSEIRAITAATPYITIHVGNKSYLDTGTLRSIQAQLDKGLFIRVHKSTIVNIRYVQSYTSRSNGDYDLIMNDKTIRLSRNFASDFKKAFAAGTQVSP